MYWIVIRKLVLSALFRLGEHLWAFIRLQTPSMTGPGMVNWLVGILTGIPRCRKLPLILWINPMSPLHIFRKGGCVPMNGTTIRILIQASKYWLYWMNPPMKVGPMGSIIPYPGIMNSMGAGLFIPVVDIQRKVTRNQIL